MFAFFPFGKVALLVMLLPSQGAYIQAKKAGFLFMRLIYQFCFSLDHTNPIVV